MKYLKITAAVLVSALVLACTAPFPQKAVNTAKAAFTEAQTAKADAYAPDSFKAAQDAQTAMQAEIDAQNAKTSGKSYTKTSELAQALLTAANKAKADATANLDTFKNDVSSLLSDVPASLSIVQAEVQLAANNQKVAKKANIDIQSLTNQVTDGQQIVKDAQAANDAQDYATAKVKLSALKDSLAQAQTLLETAGFKAEAAAK